MARKKSLSSKELQVLAKSKDERFWKYDHYIGCGSFKKVYKGWDNEENRCIAWCEIELCDHGGSGNKEKTMKEISVLQSINNPHVLQLFSSWEDTHRRIMVLATELMTGGTLKEYGKCPLIVIRNCGRQILQGLDALHTHQPPIIHRDLKCRNIFIDKASGTVKIGDLGLARLKSTISRTKSKQKGTPVFKAPEIVTGHYNELVDVYSFGMCLLELSTGEYPYEEYEDDWQVFNAVVNEKKPPQVLENVADNVLKDLITGCIKSDPKERYTVTKLLSHLFFLENQFEVIVQQQDRRPNSKTALMTIQDAGNHSNTIVYHYDFERHTPQSVTEELISSGRLSESNCNAVIDALTEKTAILSLLSKTSNGIVQEETDSGVVMDTRYSTDASTGKTVIEEEKKGEIQADDGAKVNPDTMGTRHSTITEEIPVNQQPPPDHHHPATIGVNGVIPDPNESGILDSLPTLKGEDFLETLKTPEASIDILKDDAPASSPPNKEYDRWRKNGSDVLKLLGEANFLSAAGVLHEKSLIFNELYTDIVTPQTGATQREQITYLFNIIERKLQDTDREIVETTWKAFINAVCKIDNRYKKIKTDLELLVNEQLKSEHEAFRSTKERLCLLLQSSLTSLTDQLWSASVITDDEKRQVMNETFHYHQKWMRIMKDQISEQIKLDPTVFYTVVETLKRVDGLKKAIDKYLTL